MSQEKVDRYKEEKANRKKNMAKAKRNRILTYIIVIVVVLLIAAWIIYSAVNSILRSQAAKQTPVNLDAVSNYLMELNSSGDAEDSDDEKPDDEGSGDQADDNSGDEDSDNQADDNSGDEAQDGDSDNQADDNSGE